MRETAVALAAAIRRGDRRALARAITLVESTRAEDRREAEAILADLLPATGGSLRLGISGAPGAGKSAFIEAFGRQAIAMGKKIAVLAIDPSSPISGGSILGDKTRMAELARHPDAFIRPSPGGAGTGGLARRTYETLLLCEAAGHDLVIVETIGSGQSETLIADLADMLLLLIAPGSGDELQGIKRGAMELAHLVILTKADGDLRERAERAQADMAEALRLIGPRERDWPGEALACSALDNRGIAEIWARVAAFAESRRNSGALENARRARARAWFEREIREGLIEALAADPLAGALREDLASAIAAQRLTPMTAAKDFVERLLKGKA